MRQSTLIAVLLASVTLAGGAAFEAALAQGGPPPGPGPGISSGPPPGGPGAGGPGAQFAPGPRDGAGQIPDARRQALREQIKATLQACREEAAAQGLDGPARKEQVRSCFKAKMPQVAKRMECRRDGIARGMVQPELRDYVRQCLGNKG